MLGWFKKKFKKEESEEAPDAAELKIPVAPRDFGPHKETKKEDDAQITPLDKKTDASAIQPEHAAETGEKTNAEEEVVTQDTRPAGESVEETTAAETVPEESVEDVGETEKSEAEEPSLPDTASVDESSVVTTATGQSPTDEIQDEETIAEPSSGSLAETKKRAVSPEKIPVAATRTPVVEEPERKEEKKDGFFGRLSEKISRTRENFTYQLDTLFLGKKLIDTELLDDLEELLITADLGVSTTEEILEYARKKVKRDELSDPAALKKLIKERIKKFIIDYQENAELVRPAKGPFVIMMVGVNGVGKTTTIGKIAHKFLQAKQSVLLVAADTFRAAAVSQLKIWGERNNVPVISQHEGADPSSVVFDAIAHATARQYDVVLVDTAGRLHTQANLMEELKKIKRVMNKKLPGAPHEVMLVVDATTGQNGISQAKLFDSAVNLTGITLTKLDGTAKGGIVANICRELKTPIRFIGVGEQLEDLREFDPDEFVEALFQGRNTESH